MVRNSVSGEIVRFNNIIYMWNKISANTSMNAQPAKDLSRSDRTKAFLKSCKHFNSNLFLVKTANIWFVDSFMKFFKGYNTRSPKGVSSLTKRNHLICRNYNIFIFLEIKYLFQHGYTFHSTNFWKNSKLSSQWLQTWCYEWKSR